MKNKKNLILTIALVVVVSGASFYGGYAYGQSKKVSFNPGMIKNGEMPSGDFANRQGNRQQGNTGATQVSGEILKTDDTSITVKTGEASSTTVYLKNDIFVGKMVEVEKSELGVGKSVLVLGSKGVDGSFVAESVQIR